MQGWNTGFNRNWKSDYKDVESADAVILTTDMPIKNVERFDNLKKVKIGISPAIKQADAIVAKMISMLNA